MSVNKVILLGFLGNDPDVRATQGGSTVATISLATTKKWRDKQSGEMKQETEWSRVVFFNRLAEIAGQYLKKGSQIYVEGRLQTRKWQDKNGIDRYTTEIIANEMQMLGGNNQQSGGYEQQQGGGFGQQGGNFNQQQPNMPDFDQIGDDISF